MHGKKRQKFINSIFLQLDAYDNAIYVHNKKMCEFCASQKFQWKSEQCAQFIIQNSIFQLQKKKKNMRKVTSVTEKNFNNLNFPILYSTTIYLSIYLSDKKIFFFNQKKKMLQKKFIHYY